MIVGKYRELVLNILLFISTLSALATLYDIVFSNISAFDIAIFFTLSLFTVIILFIRRSNLSDVITSDVVYYINVSNSGRTAHAHKIAKHKSTKHLTKLRDTNLSGTYGINNVCTNIGNVDFYEEGGLYSAITNVDPPLEANSMFIRILHYSASNAFLENSESFSLFIQDKHRNIIIIIDLPNDRPLSNYTLKYDYNNRLYPLEENIAYLRCNNIITAFIDNPIPGAKYTISWNW